MPKEESSQPFERIYQPRGKMMLDNFLGGICWSLGTLVGATIIVALIGFTLSKVDLIPIIGSWITQIIQAINFKNPNLPIK